MSNVLPEAFHSTAMTAPARILLVPRPVTQHCCHLVDTCRLTFTNSGNPCTNMCVFCGVKFGGGGTQHKSTHWTKQLILLRICKLIENY